MVKGSGEADKKHNSVAVYTYVTSIIEWLEDVKERLLAKTETLQMYEARHLEHVMNVLRDYEYEELWKEFSKELSEEGIDPTSYRAGFDDLIVWKHAVTRQLCHYGAT